MRKTISMSVVTVAAILTLAICSLASKADEINGVKYVLTGGSVGEKWWEKQIIHTNLYDTFAEGAIVFDYGGAWEQVEATAKGFKCIEKPNFGSFPISIEERTPLQPLIKIELVEGPCAIETIDKAKNVYRFKSDGRQLVIMRTMFGKDDAVESWVKLHVVAAGNIVEQKKVDGWPNNNVYMVKVEKGDILEFCSSGASVSVWKYSEAAAAK